MGELLFTSSAILETLVQIDELKDKNIDWVETVEGELQLTIGNSTYIIKPKEDNIIEVDDDTIEQVEDVNLSAYTELEQAGEIQLDEIVESGIVKELTKTLLIGGIVRLTNKLLGNRK